MLPNADRMAVTDPGGRPTSILSAMVAFTRGANVTGVGLGSVVTEGLGEGIADGEGVGADSEARTGCQDRSQPIANPPVVMRRSPVPSGRIVYTSYVPVLSTFPVTSLAVNASRLPSGAQTAGPSSRSLGVSFVRPLPSAFTTQSSHCSPSWATNEICVPSGDHAAFVASTPGRSVSLRSPEPSVFTT